LEQEGFINTVPGKGSFIAEQNSPLIQERRRNKLEETIAAVLQMSKELNMTMDELFELMNFLQEEDLE
jgi:GntR family transcriptional regulator